MHKITVVALGAMLSTGMLVAPRIATADQWHAGVGRSNVTVPGMETRIPGDYQGSSPGNRLSAEISAPLKEDSAQAADFDLRLVGTLNGRSWSRDAAVLRIQNTGSGYTLGYLPTDDTRAGYRPGGGRELCDGPLSVVGSAISATVNANGQCSGAFPGVNGAWTVSFTGKAIRIQSINGKRLLTFRKVS
jgi:hypothetical protein